MSRTSVKLSTVSLADVCAAADQHLGEWHYAAKIGTERGFDLAPTDEQITTILHGIGALTDILRAGMTARQIEAMRAEGERMRAEIKATTAARRA